MKEIEKILCAVDFSDHAPKVAHWAAYMAEKLETEVICLYVAPTLSQYMGFNVPPTSIENFVGEIVAGASKTMDEFLNTYFAKIKSRGIVITGYAAEAIVRVAAEEGASFIVMGTMGRRGLDRMLFGSVAEKVLKTACCPVMTIRPVALPDLRKP